MNKLISLTLALVMLLCLAACGSSEAPNPAPSTIPAVQPEPSTDAAIQEDGSAYVGFYKMPEGFLEVQEDGTFEMLDFDGVVHTAGQCMFQDGLTLVIDGEKTLFFVLDEEKNIYGGEDVGTCFRLGEEESLDAPNGFLPDEYVDTWYLFGDLTFPCLTVHADGLWELRNSLDDNGSLLLCEGFSSLDGNSDLRLYENNGNEVGFVTLAQEELTLVLTMDYEFLLEAYLSGDLVFSREENAMSLEPQGLQESAFQGYWMYDNGYILQIVDTQWYAYEKDGRLFQSGSVEYEDGAAYLMNADGSSGGGMLSFNEDGDAFESGLRVTKLDAFPYGNTEG